MSEVAIKNEAAVELKETTTAMSEKIAQHIKFEESNLTLPSDLARSLMVAALGEEATANYEKGKAFVVGEMLPGLAHATGESAVKYMKENKDVDIVSVTMPFAKDKLAATVQRKAEVGFGSSEKTVKYGHVSANLLTGGLGNSTGELKKVRTSIGQLAAAELAK